MRALLSVASSANTSTIVATQFPHPLLLPALDPNTRPT